MNFSAKNLIRILEQKAFILNAQMADTICFSTLPGKTIIVPVHSNKDLAKGTFYSILKQASINKNDI